MKIIKIESTPNKHTNKFVLDIILSKKMREYTQPDKNSLLSKSLMKTNQIASICIYNNFISVTKKDLIYWKNIKTKVKRIITRNLKSEFNLHNSQKIETDTRIQHSALFDKIQEVIDNYIQPIIAADGGYITLHSVTNNIVSIQMHGACINCPSSTVTLKSGIEVLIKHYFPKIVKVILI